VTAASWRTLEADAELQDFTRSTVRDRLAELQPDEEEAAERIRAGFELVREGCEKYLNSLGVANGIVTSAPTLNGQDLASDPRIHPWRDAAQAPLDSDIALLSLTELGEWKANQHE
jgi:hypothetical protein